MKDSAQMFGFRVVTWGEMQSFSFSSLFDLHPGLPANALSRLGCHTCRRSVDLSLSFSLCPLAKILAVYADNHRFDDVGTTRTQLC